MHICLAGPTPMAHVTIDEIVRDATTFAHGCAAAVMATERRVESHDRCGTDSDWMRAGPNKLRQSGASRPSPWKRQLNSPPQSAPTRWASGLRRRSLNCAAQSARSAMALLTRGRSGGNNLLPSKFMTASEIESPKSGNLSERAMIQVVVKRAHQLGMHALSETAKGHIVAVVARASNVETTGRARCELLRKVKEDLGTTKKTRHGGIA
eukprot:9467731-Pyramimonas_sp.AAC.1